MALRWRCADALQAWVAGCVLPGCCHALGRASPHGPCLLLELVLLPGWNCEGCTLLALCTLWREQAILEQAGPKGLAVA